METKNHHFNFFWQVPVIALVVPLVAIIMMAARVRGVFGTIAVAIYQVMFLITPADPTARCSLTLLICKQIFI